MKLILKSCDGYVRVIADSAIGRNAQPWFLPDFGNNWRWHRALAYRVSRLGKNIASDYAARYLDAVTLLWVPVADDNPSADFMDGAVVCGRWIETSEIDPEIVNMLVEVTFSATVKNGDIIARILPGDGSPIVLNNHISLSLCNQEVLGFNVK